MQTNFVRLAIFGLVVFTGCHVPPTTDADGGSDGGTDAADGGGFTSLVCGGACSWPGKCTNEGGNLVVIEDHCLVRGQAGLDLLRGYQTVETRRDFEVRLEESVETEISFDGLLEIGGSLRVRSDGGPARSYSFPDLVKVGSNVQFQGEPGASALSFSSLTTIEGGLFIGQSSELSVVEIPTLVSIGTSISVQANPMLGRLSIPNVAVLSRDFILSDNASLVAVEMTNLDSVGEVCQFRGNSDAAYCDSVEWLTAVEGCTPPFEDLSPPVCE